MKGKGGEENERDGGGSRRRRRRMGWDGLDGGQKGQGKRETKNAD